MTHSIVSHGIVLSGLKFIKEESECNMSSMQKDGVHVGLIFWDETKLVYKCKSSMDGNIYELAKR